MKQPFYKKLLLAINIIGLALVGLSLPTYSADVCQSGVNDAVREAAGCNDSSSNNALPGIISSILYSIIAVSGLVAVIFVLIGGYNYMTSAGDAGKLEKAKKTILYACIGLVVCALAFTIVNWTINAIQRTPTDDSSQSQDSEDNQTEDNKD